MTQVIGTIGAAPEAVGTGCEGLTKHHLEQTERNLAVADSSPKPLPRRLRFEVLRRDNHTCRYCGGSAPDVKLTVDHVVPVSLGGKHEPSNLVTACHDCNAGKASSSPDSETVARVSDDAMRWSAAIKEAAARLVERDREADEYLAQVDEAWMGYHRNPFDGDTAENQVYRPTSWENSVRQFRAAGLPVEAAVEAVHIAMDRKSIKNSDVFRYFCGICWRRIEELQQIAARILEESA